MKTFSTLRQLILFLIFFIAFANAQTPSLGTYQCTQDDDGTPWTLELSQSTFTFGDLQGDWRVFSEEEIASSGMDASVIAGQGSLFQLTVNDEVRAIGVFYTGNGTPVVYLQTPEGLALTCTASQIANAPTTQPEEAQPEEQAPQLQPNTQTPTTRSPEQLTAMGIDPETMLIPDTFHCYEEFESDNYSQYSFALTILQGNRYSTPDGDGDYTTEENGSLIDVAFPSGPLSGDYTYGFTSYDDYGQKIALGGIGPDEVDYNCYQQGPREQQTLLEWAFKDPQPSTYTCVEEDTTNPGPTLEILGGRRYRVDGQEGEYAVDILSDPDDDLYSIDYLTGPWADGYGNAFGDEATGLREMTVSSDYGDFDCSRLGEPLQSINYGVALAPAPPAGSGGLEGLYGSWQPDVIGVCGGLCWSFLYFRPEGYVYQESPEGLLEDIDCTRTQPNGAPLCDTYKLEGDTIIFGSGDTETMNGAEIDGYTRIEKADGVQLNGTYTSFSYLQTNLDPNTNSGVAAERTLTFNPDGTFTSENFVGATAPNVVVSSESGSSGVYQIQGNTLTFNFSDGQVRREFFFVFPDEDPANPGALRIGGSDYSRE
jgi:hypothetical protein